MLCPSRPLCLAAFQPPQLFQVWVSLRDSLAKNSTAVFIRQYGCFVSAYFARRFYYFILVEAYKRSENRLVGNGIGNVYAFKRLTCHLPQAFSRNNGSAPFPFSYFARYSHHKPSQQRNHKLLGAFFMYLGLNFGYGYCFDRKLAV